MTETGDSQLERKRFVINPESIAEMKKLRSTFQELQQEYPYLSGLGFFGSRAKGTEHKGSDYDVCVFYNSDRIYTLQSGNREQWQQIRNTLEQKLNTYLDHRLEDPSAGLRINISNERTENQLEMFIDAAKPFVDQDVDEDTLLKVVGIPPTQDLYSRFFLVVGDEVYTNRQFILDRLKATPNGDKYFQALMRSLAWFERGNEGKSPTPRYQGYPKTIEEAERYFY